MSSKAKSISWDNPFNTFFGGYLPLGDRRFSRWWSLNRRTCSPRTARRRRKTISPGSVADPNPDPDLHVFGSPGSGSGSTSQRYGSGSGSCSGSGSFYCHAKIVRKPLTRQKKIVFKINFLLASWRSMTKIAGSGSRIRIRIRIH